MKWIGQHIYDLVSRFRDDVYLEDLSTTTETNVLVVNSDGKISKSTTLADDIIESEIDTLAGLTDIGATGVNLEIHHDDIQWYNPVNNGNPQLSIGSGVNERFVIWPAYASGTQTLEYVRFSTYTASGTANYGRFSFNVDETHILNIDDGGINFQADKGISINGTDILTDSSGTATLSNIDALDATTIATFETAMEANLDTFGSQMTSASSLATVGTIGTGVWQGTAIASAYLDAETAHLSVNQTYTAQMTFDGNKEVVPGDGAVIHVDSHDVTDSDTSASGTAAKYTHVNIEKPRLAATNSSVTTTSAANLYIAGDISAHTNQTITNNYALWVDAGLVKFDGALTVDGTITGDVTGNADTATTAATVTGATQPAIESIGTDGDTLAILADQLQMSNATTKMPTIKLTNTTDDDVSSELVFEKLRDDNAVAQGQNLGAIWFRGQDASTYSEDYAYIIGEIDVSTGGQESGKLTLGVANHDGGNGSGLILTGGSEDNEIDVTVGLGANSVTTVAGDLAVTGDITGGHLMHYSIAGYGVGDGTNYEMVNQLSGNTAPFEHNISIGADGVTATTTNNMVRSAGIVMLRACTLKRWTGWATCNGTGDSFIGLFKVTPTRDDSTALSAVELEEFQFTALGNNKMEDFDIVEGDMTATAIAAGDIIISAIKAVSGKTIYFTSTFEVEF